MHLRTISQAVTWWIQASSGMLLIACCTALSMRAGMENWALAFRIAATTPWFVERRVQPGADHRPGADRAGGADRVGQESPGAPRGVDRALAEPVGGDDRGADRRGHDAQQRVQPSDLVVPVVDSLFEEDTDG